MRNIKLCVFLGLLWAPITARADFILSDSAQNELKLFITDANKDVSAFSGHVGDNNSGPIVNVTTVGNVNTGSGFANITPVKDGILSSLTFIPENPNLFTDFCFRGQLTATGDIGINVQDNQGGDLQTLTVHIVKTNQDFDQICIVVESGTNETLQFVDIFTDPNLTSFEEVKQVEFSTGEAAVPEPATLALLGLGLVAMGMARRRTK